MMADSNRRTEQAHPKGRPLAMLVLLLGVWILARALLWETPFAAPDAPLERLAASSEKIPFAAQPPSADLPPAHFEANSPAAQFSAGYVGALPAWPQTPLVQKQVVPPIAPLVEAPTRPVSAWANPQTAAGHQLLYMAAMSRLPVPKFYGGGLVTPAGPDTPQPPLIAKNGVDERVDRWSLDAWVFWRDGSGAGLTNAGRAPTYGASQTAGVLRYRFAPNSKHDPRGYFRAYRALIDGGEGELALGLSARPIGAVPVRAHAEMRATRFDRDWDARPAVFATTELAPLQLPGKLRAEAYVQGGYVGGNRSTAFADGQLHVMRDLAEFDMGKLSLGAAAWGGAQEGAERLDVGPSIRLDLKIGEAPARLSLDWRERVGGDAAPGSGVALTLSTRF